MREARLTDVAIVGRLYEERKAFTREPPVWKMILKEMPTRELLGRRFWIFVLKIERSI